MASPRPGFRLQPGRGEARLEERRELVGRDPLQPHHRAGLVERPLHPDHLLHQARLGAGEHVADLPLLLHGGAQRVLDLAVVEGGHRLELVEGDDDLAAEPLGEQPGQREHLFGEPAGVARRADGGEGDREGGAGRAGLEPHVGP